MAAKIQSMAHISFYTEHFEEMLEFYHKKLGATLWVLVRYSSYFDRPDKPTMQEAARKDPNKIFYAYLKLGADLFIELFPATERQKPRIGAWNEYCGYSHAALIVEDIQSAYRDLIAAGIEPDTAPSKGPSETWQFWFHDPDGNMFEMMQYTERSFQRTGHIDEEV